MQLQQLIAQSGPLPLKGGFVTETNGPSVLVVTGSLYSSLANTPLQMVISLDGKPIGVAQIWSNGASTHRVLPTAFIGLPPLSSDDMHTITLSIAQGNPAVSDVNDMFSASIIY